MTTTLNSEELAAAVSARVRDLLAARRAAPRATYRVQFHAGFTFRDAAELVPYLHALGVSDLYASPYLKAGPGSGHGYDVVDHNHLNPELGSTADFDELCDALRRRGMRQVLDFVPNHMGIVSGENLWWQDVLENGQSSPYAHFFDIDWYPAKAELAGKVLLPVLGGQYGHVLEAGELRLEFHEGAFSIRYYDQRFPLDPRTATEVLGLNIDALREEMQPESPAVLEYESILTGLERLPDCSTTLPEAVAERRREKEIVKRRLATLASDEPAIQSFIERNVAAFNGDAADPSSFDLLDRLLQRQPYRLSHWKAAADEINYRRFFDINELAALSMEDPDVFLRAHALVTELLVRGDVLGLRLDHIDGLYNPREYLHRLQWNFVRALARVVFAREHGDETEEQGDESEEHPKWDEIEPACLAALAPLVGSDAPALWHDLASRGIVERDPPASFDFAAPEPSAVGEQDAAHAPPPLYVVVEKILGPDEPLPEDWATAGTSGYDFLNQLGGLFIDPAGRQAVVKAYERFIGRHLDFAEVAYAGKKLILRSALASEVQMLAHRLNRISERHRRSRDFTLNSLGQALREVLTCFPVYRTYIDSAGISEGDRRFVLQAIAQAKRRNPTVDVALFDFIRDTLLSADWAAADTATYYERLLFAGRFQQITSPAMAKGIEDTAFYQYVPLLSQNEVGGDPRHAVTSVEAFHRDNLERRTARPTTMTCTTTHDTKRSEDVRARISVLSEVPHLWRAALNRWARLNRRFRREVDGAPAPSRNDEYLFYQSLLGIWPLARPQAAELAELAARLQGYMEKATREAKLRTSWINPNEAYDRGVADFVAAVLDPRRGGRFLDEVEQLHERIIDWGLYSALAQAFGKLLAPGVPDIYQGQEFWDFSLVDPDNRRPVDFARRRSLLGEFEGSAARNDGRLHSAARDLARNVRDDRIKLLVTWRSLQFRREHALLFQGGEYRPLEVAGEKAAHVCAWAWQLPDRADLAIVVLPRLIARLTSPPEGESIAPPPLGDEVWHNTRLVAADLAGIELQHEFTGQTIHWPTTGLSLAEALRDFPLALLSRKSHP